MKTQTRPRDGNGSPRQLGDRKRKVFFWRDGQRAIFMPLVGMRIANRLSSAAEVCRRANLPPAWFTKLRQRAQQRRDLFLLDYLYGIEEAKGLKLLYRSYGIKRGARAGELLVEPEMIAFHDQAYPHVVATEARRLGTVGTSGSMLKAIRDACPNDYQFQRWAESWVFRGGEAWGEMPLRDVRVHVVSEREARVLESAFDFNFALTDPSVRRQNTSYPAWLNSFPASTAHELYFWVQWLFGGPEPAGWVVVTDEMKRVRREHVFDRVCEQAHVNKVLIKKRLAEPWINDAVSAAVAGGSRYVNAESMNAFEGWQSLQPQTRRMLWGYVEASRQKSKFKNAGVDVSRKTGWLNRAASVGSDCRGDLEAFLAGRPVTGWRDPRTYGVIGTTLYLPPPAAGDFRLIAATRSRELGLSAVLNKLTRATSQICLEMAILSIALPRPVQGRVPAYWGLFRSAIARGAASAKRNALLHAEPLPEHNRRRRRGRPTNQDKVERDRQIVADWQTREYTDFGVLGRKWNLSRGAIKNIIDRATRRRPR
jgi:hypothetical protein